MDRLKNLYSLFFIVVNTIIVLAQNNNVLNKTTTNTSVFSEYIITNVNTSTLISGETLYYKIYCFNSENNQLSTYSKIAYLELIGENKQTIFKQKLNIENGVTNGDLFIPTTLKTGSYKLITYTKWMQSISDKHFFEMDIIIINPYQLLNSDKAISKTEMDSTVGLKKKNPITEIKNVAIIDTIKLELNKKTFLYRDKVNLKLTTTTRDIQKGNYSISIRKIDSLSNYNTVSPKKILEFNKLNSTNKPLRLAEIRGEQLSGSITSKNGTSDLYHKTIGLSFSGKSFDFKIIETDRFGKFTFILNKNLNLTNAVIQVIEDNRNDYTIQLDDPFNVDLSQLHLLSDLKLNANLKKTLESRSVANQIENGYYAQKKDSIIESNSISPFYHNLEKVYILDDYTRFPSFKETITEVILEIYFTKNKNKYSIHLRNNVINSEVFGLPLLLVDGLYIQDADELFSYDPENIEKISLINEPYVYGPKTFSGVINISTKNQDYQTKSSGKFMLKTALERPVLQKEHFSPDYSLNKKNDRIPDYRYQLLWEPNVIFDDTEKNITFYTSDIDGIFEVIIEGYTENGNPIYSKTVFEVK